MESIYKPHSSEIFKAAVSFTGFVIYNHKADQLQLKLGHIEDMQF